MTTGETLIAAVRRAREREDQAWTEVRKLSDAHTEARRRALACEKEREAAGANLLAFTIPRLALSLEAEFEASLDGAMAAYARLTAAAG